MTAAPRFRIDPRLALAPLFALALSACSGGGAGPMQMPPTEVNVATVVSKPVTQWDEFTGRIEAVEHIEIRPRVAGYLTGIHFQEGRAVKAGDLLFTIDDREYKAAVASARADLARAEARRAAARALAAQLPEARVSVYPDDGHSPFLESTERFNRELEEFALQAHAVR